MNLVFSVLRKEMSYYIPVLYHYIAGTPGNVHSLVIRLVPQNCLGGMFFLTAFRFLHSSEVSIWISQNALGCPWDFILYLAENHYLIQIASSTLSTIFLQHILPLGWDGPLLHLQMQSSPRSSEWILNSEEQRVNQNYNWYLLKLVSSSLPLE